MDAFPAFVPLEGRTVLVVGEGEMADGKAELFIGSPATLVRRPFGPQALVPAFYAGVDLVFIASEDEGAAAEAAGAARAAGVRMVNVVDRPALCDFFTPAIVDRGLVVAAVGTTGSGPLLARRLKARIEAAMPEGVADLARLLRRLQGAVRSRLPAFADRTVFLDAVIEGPAGDLARAGDVEGAEILALKALGEALPKGSDRGSGSLEEKEP